MLGDVCLGPCPKVSGIMQSSESWLIRFVYTEVIVPTVNAKMDQVVRQVLSPLLMERWWNCWRYQRHIRTKEGCVPHGFVWIAHFEIHNVALLHLKANLGSTPEWSMYVDKKLVAHATKSGSGAHYLFCTISANVLTSSSYVPLSMPWLLAAWKWPKRLIVEQIACHLQLLPSTTHLGLWMIFS